MRHLRLEELFLPPRCAASMYQRVADCNIDWKETSSTKSRLIRLTQCSDQQAKAGDRRSIRILVAAVNRLKRSPNERPIVDSRLTKPSVISVFVENAMKQSQQEVSGTARRIDRSQVFETKDVDGRLKCQVKDKLLNIFRRLKKTVTFARTFGKVLV
jgi:hypothetical protein